MAFEIIKLTYLLTYYKGQGQGQPKRQFLDGVKQWLVENRLKWKTTTIEIPGDAAQYLSPTVKEEGQSINV